MPDAPSTWRPTISWGKLRNEPLWKLWGLRIDRLPPSDYTIGIDSPDVMLSKLAQMPGFPVYKIKLGGPQDLEVVAALRRHTDAAFRVDVNCGWTAAETLAKAPTLAALGVELIEQPLPPEQWDDMQKVFARSPLPLLADESCRGLADVERCAGVFSRGERQVGQVRRPGPARRMIDRRGNWA